MGKEKLRLPNYGGQALIEGVLMRGKYTAAAAMRAPDGRIVIESEKLTGIYTGKLAKIPFFRGIVILWDSLGLGTRFLTKSANVQTGENEKIEGATLYLTLAASFAIAILIFFLAPAAIGKWIQNLAGISSLAMNLIEGFIRLGAIILYIWVIGRTKDIADVFAYHGAEHKTINAYEAGAELIPQVVQNYSIAHPRCGTSFLLTLVVMSILVFSLIGSLPMVWLLLSRILLIPVLAMLSYEYIRWTSNHLDSPIILWLMKPNLALQSLTTRQPTVEMLEVSIASFNAMLAEESKVLMEQSLSPQPTLETV